MGIGKPDIQIVSNDGFCNDTLIGAVTSQYTNIMYIQHSDLVTATGNINVDSDNNSERLQVHTTRLE